MSKQEQSWQMEDLLKQHKIVVSAMDGVMTGCGSIFPAAPVLQDLEKEIIEAIKCQAAIDVGVAPQIEDDRQKSTTNWAWDWMDQFNEWRKERGGVVAFGRKEGK